MSVERKKKVVKKQRRSKKKIWCKKVLLCGQKRSLTFWLVKAMVFALVHTNPSSNPSSCPHNSLFNLCRQTTWRLLNRACYTGGYYL
jgi:hypothetical protein